jgi:hypothetical protein
MVTVAMSVERADAARRAIREWITATQAQWLVELANGIDRKIGTGEELWDDEAVLASQAALMADAARVMAELGHEVDMARRKVRST